MSTKQPNHHIECDVESCRFHYGREDYCSLNAIKVEACENGNTGKPDDESMCGSYRAK